MKNLKIDKRLQAVASLVDKCDLVADIGTDHGYLPIYLIQNGIVKKAIASDVAVGPLSQAKDNTIKYHLEDKIKPILSDGLDNIDEIPDCLIFAGMGANLIIDILSRRKHDYDCLILQPNLNTYLLREYIVSQNYKIIDEKVEIVHNKYYDIMKVVKGKQQLNELEIKYGPINLVKKETNFKLKLESLLNNYEKILTDFKGNDQERDKLLNEVNEIKKIL